MKLVLLIVYLSLPAFILGQADFPSTDAQIWSDLVVSKGILKAKDQTGKEFEKVAIFFNGTLRFGKNSTRLIDSRVGFGLDYRINKHLYLTPSFLYRINKGTLIRNDYESRFRFAATIENKWSKAGLKLRNLVEYRLRNSRADSIRYRLKATINFPFIRNQKEIISPFFADEVYYDFHDKLWSRNDFSVGVSRKFTKKYSADFYYLREENQKGLPKSINSLGLALKVKFD